MALEFALAVYDFDRYSSFKYRLFCTAEYDTDDDEMGAMNKEAKPLRRLKQDLFCHHV